MLDAIEIHIAGGNGGNGVVSYHREKFVPEGGPDGGDGGRGGRIFLKAVDDIYTLEQYRARRKFTAGNGGNGGTNLRTGAHGTDTFLEVPAGTVIHDAETGDLIADLAAIGDEVLVAHGGRGGWGNKRFATSTNKTPGFSQKGQQGEELDIRLELRLLADVGLIGLPNAGKSTLLSAVSNARPKIANYPFTTLEPMLGVVNVGYERFTMADLPGLVEGASEGYGLGFEFLKHIRRCRVLLHLIDSTSPDPVTDYELIEGELRAYDAKLDDVARVVAVTKADIDETAARASADTLAAHLGRPVRMISAELEIGTEALTAELMALVNEEKARAVDHRSNDEIPVLRPASEERFSVYREADGKFVIEGYRAVSFVQMMDTEMPGAYDEILRRLERWGIAKVLRREGIEPGDVMVFGDVELAWER
jgi:GTP-binding protein